MFKQFALDIVMVNELKFRFKFAIFTKMQRSAKHIPLLKLVSVATLLGIYFAGSLFNNLHKYIHHDHHSHEVCTAETEKNPCHIKVFHHNITDGCKHDTHMFSAENSCKLCDGILAKYYFPDELGFDQIESEFQLSEPFVTSNFIFRYSNAAIWLRGPPSSLFI